MYGSGVVRVHLVLVLYNRANVYRVAFLVIPLFRSAMMRRLRVILGGRQRSVVFRAFLGRGRSTCATISVLRQVSSLGLRVRIRSVFGDLFFFSIMLYGRHFRFVYGFFQGYDVRTASFVQRLFVVTCDGPVFSKVANATLWSRVGFFSGLLYRDYLYIVGGRVGAPRIVYYFGRVIRVRRVFFCASNINFGSVSNLVINRTTTFGVVKIVYWIGLYLVMGAAKVHAYLLLL